jgi:hypothetical protein
MNRQELTQKIKDLPVDQYSNIKFYRLLVSRLGELDIPLEDAKNIASNVEYDFSNIPEDDDSLSEFATEYAEYCKKIYSHMKINGIKDIKPILKYFKTFKLEIESL